MNNEHFSRRVVVTGMGLISPVGLNVATGWANVVSGQSGIGRITLFNTDDLRVQIAGEAWNFDPTHFMPAKEARRADRNVQFALAATQEAMAQAQLPLCLRQAPTVNVDDVGVLIGSGAGGIWTYTAQQALMDKYGPARLSPLLIPMLTVDSASVQVSILTGACGPSFGLASACASGADAIGTAFEIIRRGDAEVMISGGAEAAVTRLGIAGFDQLRALSRRNESPAEACRPFDATRDGFVMGEGAGILILEALPHALGRGAEPLAELVSYKTTSDATHLTSPDTNASQAARAIRGVLDRAGVHPEQVDYINAHGTATPLGDIFEVQAVKRVFGKAAYGVPITSTKSVTGHLLGAAGAVEAIWCVMALREGCIPPTVNYRQPDPECDLDVVPNRARPASLRFALSHAFGFGGHNAVLLLRRWETNSPQGVISSFCAAATWWRKKQPALKAMSRSSQAVLRAAF
jgi:3-oxoacyl-[acyl-carrier-protein] synthase II